MKSWFIKRKILNVIGSYVIFDLEYHINSPKSEFSLGR